MSIDSYTWNSPTYSAVQVGPTTVTDILTMIGADNFYTVSTPHGLRYFLTRHDRAGLVERIEVNVGEWVVYEADALGSRIWSYLDSVFTANFTIVEE